MMIILFTCSDGAAAAVATTMDIKITTLQLVLLLPVVLIVGGVSLK
jgi:hypothetical protein